MTYQKWSQSHPQVKAADDWNPLVDAVNSMSGVHVNATFITDADELIGLPSSLRHRSLSGAGDSQLHVPRRHSPSHVTTGIDPLQVGTPSNIGVANAQGALTDFVRRDHVHNHPAGLGVDLHHPQIHAPTHSGGGTDPVYINAGQVTSGVFAMELIPSGYSHRWLANVGTNLHHRREKTATYIIGVSGANYYSVNGTTGQVEFSDVDARVVIQNTVDICLSGYIYLKEGRYSLTSGINLKGYPIRFGGASRNATVLVSSAIAGAILHARGQIEVENLTLIGAGRANSGSYGIFMDAQEVNGCRDSTFSRIRIGDCGDAMRFENDTWSIYFYNIWTYGVQRGVVHRTSVTHGLNAIFEDVWITNEGEAPDIGFDIEQGNALMVYRSQVLWPNFDGFIMRRNEGVSILDGLQTDYCGRHGIDLGDGLGGLPSWLHVQIVNSTFSTREWDSPGGVIPRYGMYLHNANRVQVSNVRLKGGGGGVTGSVGPTLLIVSGAIVNIDNLTVETHNYHSGVCSSFDHGIQFVDCYDVLMSNVSVWSLSQPVSGMAGVFVSGGDNIQIGQIFVEDSFTHGVVTSGTGEVLGWYPSGSVFGRYWRNTDFRLYDINHRAFVYEPISNILHIGYQEIAPRVFDFSGIELHAPEITSWGDFSIVSGMDLYLNKDGQRLFFGTANDTVLSGAGRMLRVQDLIDARSGYFLGGTRIFSDVRRPMEFDDVGAVAVGGIMGVIRYDSGGNTFYIPFHSGYT